MSGQGTSIEPFRNVAAAEIDSEAFQKILSASEPVEYHEDDVIMASGSDSQSICYVEKGTVEVSYSTKGTNIVVALIGKGELFGEIGFFDGVSRVRNVRAVENSTLRIWERDQVLQIRGKDPDLYGSFVTLMARSICSKFRRVLEDREPLTGYAASLSTGKRIFREARPVPEHLFVTEEWRLVNRLVERCKADFFSLGYELQREKGEDINEERRLECHGILDQFNDGLQDCFSLIEDEQIEEYLWGFVFKEIFPYFMRSRFAERAFYKPKGYAGDFLMMEMIYLNRPDGDGKLGKLVDEWCINTAAARAVRGRRKLLSSILESCSEKHRSQEAVTRILNLACGSNRELFDFLGRYKWTESIEATCVDADTEALEYTNRHVNVVPHRAAVRFMQDNVVKWALGRVRHNLGQMDIIYSAGLTDYLDRKLLQALAKRSYEHLKPGGVFVVGNFGQNNPNRAMMEHLLQWNLVHRSEADLRDIFSHTPFGKNIDVLSESEGINLFAVARKQPEGNVTV